LSKRLQEEIYFLPALFRIHPGEEGAMKAIFRERHKFWEYYALDPTMIKRIMLIDTSRDTVSEWKNGEFCLLDARSPYSADTAQANSEKELRIIAPILITPDGKLVADYVYDMQVLVSRVIPEIAQRSIEPNGLYKYRIVDAHTKSVLYSSESGSDAEFGDPDIEIPLVSDIVNMDFGERPPLPAMSLPSADIGEYPFIKEAPQDRVSGRMPDVRQRDIRSAPKDNYFDLPFGDSGKSSMAHSPKLPRQGFDHLVLQIVNRDGSLEVLAHQTSIFNAAVSIGTVFLLVVLLLALSEANRRARKLAQSQQEFISTITHELKTPLAVISSAAENLTDGIVRNQTKVEQYGTIIRKESSRLAISIDHFLLYSKTSTVARMHVSVCNIADLIQIALKFTEEERQFQQFKTEVSIPLSPHYVAGDRIALESVFQNLAQNVIRHAEKGKFLGISVSSEKGRKSKKKDRQSLIIKVWDKGPGIPLREQKPIFEPFVRGKRAMAEQVPGNGIGLNLVKRIVEMHGGSISLESKPDYGSTFIVTLPEYRGDDDAWQNTDD